MVLINHKILPRCIIGFVAGSLFFLGGCATLGGKSPVSSGPPKTLTHVLQQDISEKGSPKAGSNEPREVTIRGIKLKNTQFDFPVVVNSRVEYWVDYFTSRGRGHFERYLERSEFFIPYIVPLLKQNGMPEDLVYLAMIESGFNNLARSRAKAVGPWQFISATGKRYGLMVNWWLDERRDIRKSTLAAVEYLKDLYTMFQCWELAAAAYNAGEAKIARAVQRFGTRDFWVISKQRFLRPETRDYVPKIIAAALIAKNPEQFGFNVKKQAPAPDEAVAPDGELVKVVKTDKPEEVPESEKPDLTLSSLTENAEADEDGDDEEESANPAEPRLRPATLTIPVDPQPAEGQVAENVPLAKPVPTPHLAKDGTVGGADLEEFDVKSPADLLKVARAAGLSYMTVKSLNPELLRWCTPPSIGTFRLKLPASSREKFLSTYNHAAYPRQVKFMTYKVRRGETLSHIARHFGIKVDPISDLNGVSPKMPLKNGLRVLIPIPNDRSRSLASLDVRDPPERRRVRKSRKGNRYYKVSYKRREATRILQRAARAGGDT